MRECDVVVRGQVLSANTELRLADEVLPKLPTTKPGDLTSVTTVHLKVDEVLWGQVDQATMDFIVWTSFSNFGNNYETGQQVVVGLISDPLVADGQYRLYSDRGKFVFVGGEWKSERAATIMRDLSQIRSSFIAGRPEHVVKKAESVVAGQVIDVQLENLQADNGQSARVMRVHLGQVKTIAGMTVPNDIVVRQIMSGGYWPDWRDPAPLRQNIRAGARYCLAIRRIDSGYSIVRGINGIWEIRDAGLFFAGRSQTGWTAEKLGILFGDP